MLPSCSCSPWTDNSLNPKPFMIVPLFGFAGVRVRDSAAVRALRKPSRSKASQTQSAFMKDRAPEQTVRMCEHAVLNSGHRVGCKVSGLGYGGVFGKGSRSRSYNPPKRKNPQIVVTLSSEFMVLSLWFGVFRGLGQRWWYSE